MVRIGWDVKTAGGQGRGSGREGKLEQSVAEGREGRA